MLPMKSPGIRQAIFDTVAWTFLATLLYAPCEHSLSATCLSALLI